jgi:hypothetical protein
MKMNNINIQRNGEIMIPKSNKDSIDVKSYKLISLLLTISKLKKLLLQKLILTIKEKRLITNLAFVTNMQ